MDSCRDKLIQRDIFTVIVLFTVHVITVYKFAILKVDTHDIFIFKAALDISNGFTLFSETFTVYGALANIINYLFVTILGVTVHSIVVSTVIFYGINSVLLYFLFKDYFPYWINILSNIIVLALAPFYALNFLPWPSVYANTFVILSVICFISHGNRARSCFLVGIFSALAFWCRQPVGVVLLLTYISLLMIDLFVRKLDKRGLACQVGSLVGGFVLICAIFLGWLLWNNAFTDWWLQSVVHAGRWAQRHGSGGRKVIVSLFQIFEKDECNGFNVLIKSYLWRFMAIANIGILLISLFNEFKNKKIIFKKHNNFLLVLSFVNLGLWHQFYPVPCARHTYWASILFVGPTLYLFYSISNLFAELLPKERSRIGRVIVFSIMTIYTFYFDISTRIAAGIVKINAPYETIKTPFFFDKMKENGVYSKDYNELADLIENHLKTHPDALIVTRDRVWTGNYFQSYNRKEVIENEKKIRPLFLNWNGVEDIGIYPDWESKISEIIDKGNSIIFSSTKYQPLESRYNTYFFNIKEPFLVHIPKY